MPFYEYSKFQLERSVLNTLTLWLGCGAQEEKNVHIALLRV